jgi:hypothetical protein
VVLTAVAASPRLVHATVAAAVGLANGLIVATSKSAVALSRGVGNSMSFVNVKWLIAAVMAVAVIGSGAVALRHPAATAARPVRPAQEEPALDDLKRENERLRREVASLKQRLSEVDAVWRDAPPSDAEVLRADSRQAGDGAPGARDGLKITKEKILDRLDPTRQFPHVGAAQLWHRHWKCTVSFTEPQAGAKVQRVRVVYVDQDQLIGPVAGGGPAKTVGE